MMRTWTIAGLALVVVIVGAAWLFPPRGAVGGSEAQPDVRPQRWAAPKAVETPLVGRAEQQTELTVNWIGHWLDEDLRETLVRDVAKEFALTHPGVDVNLKFPQEILGQKAKPLSAKQYVNIIRSGKIEWDIIWLDDYIYRFVAEELGDPEWGKKYLVDFEQVPGFSESQKSFIISDPAYRNLTGGMLVGPYLEGYYFALWYNKDVAQRLGLTIKERGMTFDDFLGYVRQIYEYNQTAETPVAAMYESNDWATTEFLFHSLVKSEIGDFGNLSIDLPLERRQAILLKVFQAFEQMGQYKPLMPGWEHNVWFDTRNYPLDDRCVFYFQGTWMYSHWRGIDEEKLHKMVPTELPVFQPVNHAMGGYIPTWAVMKNSPNRKTAIQLLMAWCEPRVAEKWVRYTKNPTGIKGNLSEATLGTDVYEQYQAYMTNKYGERVHHSANADYLLGRQNAHLQEEINDNIRLILCGEITAQKAYDAIVTQCK